MSTTEHQTLADILDDARQLYPTGSFLARKIQQWRPHICPFHRLLSLVPANASVLDVGCGSGLFLGLLARRGVLKTGVGIDANRKAIAVAEAMRLAQTADVQARLRFIPLDVKEPWPDSEFDVVSLIDVMHHIPPSAQRSVIEKVAVKIRPGGLFLYKDMARRPWWMAAMNRLHDLVMARQWIQYAPLEQVRLWCADSGLAVVEEGSCHMVWYAHEWLLCRKETGSQQRSDNAMSAEATTAP